MVVGPLLWTKIYNHSLTTINHPDQCTFCRKSLPQFPTSIFLDKIYSSNSMSSKQIISEGAISEESGWTAYLEDFSLNRRENMSSCSSLISDAAWNGFNGKINPVKRLNSNNICKKKYSCDDELEDTASSPVNSPKVSSLKHMEANCRRTNYGVTFGDFLEKQEAGSDLRRDDKNGNNIMDSRKSDDEHTHDLKKRGLCLVPVSALINLLQ